MMITPVSQGIDYESKRFALYAVSQWIFSWIFHVPIPSLIG
jgi:hypothetical protein